MPETRTVLSKCSVIAIGHVADVLMCEPDAIERLAKRMAMLERLIDAKGR